MSGTPGASEALIAAAIAALRAGGSLSSVQESGPVQASEPHAIVEAGPETDWGHKTGAGREVRLAVTIRDRGEAPQRVRTLLREAEAAVSGIGAPAGWRLASLALLRSRATRTREGWTGSAEWRARMLED